MKLPASLTSLFNGDRTKRFTGILLTVTLGLVSQGVMSPAANSAEMIAKSQPVKAASLLQDGVYLYGQSAKADQIGAAYLVFEVKQHQVVGAFYMPNSSFDCFNGTLQSDRMALNIRNSYEQKTYSHSVALRSETVSASATTPATAKTGLAGYHPIQQVSQNDQRLLSTCKASLASI